MCSVLFFFFKQKTAYEMRISDWSSDVCSSDLDIAHQAIAAGREDGKRVYSVIDEECVGCNLCMHVCPVEGCITMKRVDDGQDYQNWTQHPNNRSEERRVGERVCQYV